MRRVGMCVVIVTILVMAVCFGVSAEAIFRGLSWGDPLEAPPSGDVCLADAKKRIGDRVCLVGNLDDMAVISSVPLNELEKLCKSCIDKAAPGGGYILAGTSTGLYTPKLAERWLFMAKVAREYGSYS